MFSSIRKRNAGLSIGTHHSLCKNIGGRVEKFAPFLSRISCAALTEFKTTIGLPRTVTDIASPYVLNHSENKSQEYVNGMCRACPIIGSLGGLGRHFFFGFLHKVVKMSTRTGRDATTRIKGMSED